MNLLGFNVSRSKVIADKAIAPLVQQQLPELYRIARGITRNTEDAEDLVHDACVKALKAGGSVSFQSENQLATWLRQILVNTYRDYYRRVTRSPVRSGIYHANSDDADIIVEMIESTEPSPPETMEQRQSSAAIHGAFSALPPEVRVVSVLFLVSGLAYNDIAEVTGSPIGTVMSRLARGRKALRLSLAELVSIDEDDGESSSALGGDQS